MVKEKRDSRVVVIKSNKRSGVTRRMCARNAISGQICLLNIRDLFL